MITAHPIEEDAGHLGPDGVDDQVRNDRVCSCSTVWPEESTAMAVDRVAAIRECLVGRDAPGIIGIGDALTDHDRRRRCPCAWA